MPSQSEHRLAPRTGRFGQNLRRIRKDRGLSQESMSSSRDRVADSRKKNPSWAPCLSRRGGRRRVARRGPRAHGSRHARRLGRNAGSPTSFGRGSSKEPFSGGGGIRTPETP